MTHWVIFDVNETLLDLRHAAPVFTESFERANALQTWFGICANLFPGGVFAASGLAIYLR